jgi:oligopeptide/dipeptide ABC transporter ATP-binding protein
MYAGRVVERGPVDAVFTSPQHPYTEALLQSIPMLGMTQAEPLRVIRGTVPSPLAWPEGCRFAPRCDYVFDRCRVEAPKLYAPAKGHLARCFLREEGSAAPRTAPTGGEGTVGESAGSVLQGRAAELRATLERMRSKRDGGTE